MSCERTLDPTALMADLSDHRARLRETGLLRLSGVAELSDDELIEFASGLGDAPGSPLLEWDFGAVMRMAYDPDAANYLFSAEPVPLHWDGPFHVEPRYLVFLCDRSEGSGGETTFVDTRAVARDLPAGTLESWRGVTLTYTTEKKAHYGGRFTTPLVRDHPESGETTLRFAEVVHTDRNPVDLEIQGSEDPGLYDRVQGLLTSPRYLTQHAWSPGDLVVVDNHAFLHGRRALAGNLGRSFRRVQVL